MVKLIGRRSTQALRGGVVDDAPGDRSGSPGRVRRVLTLGRVSSERHRRGPAEIGSAARAAGAPHGLGRRGPGQAVAPGRARRGEKGDGRRTRGRAPARRTIARELLAATGLLGDGDAVPRPRDAEDILADYLTDHLARGAVRALDVDSMDEPGMIACRSAAEPTRGRLTLF